jgi:hypothetical protein
MKSGMLRLNSIAGKDDVEAFLGMKFSNENFKRFVSEIIKTEIIKFKTEADDLESSIQCDEFINKIDNNIFESMVLTSDLEYYKKRLLAGGIFSYSSSRVVMNSVYKDILNNTNYKQIAILYADETISQKEIEKMEKVFFLKLLYLAMEATSTNRNGMNFVKRAFKSISAEKFAFGITGREIFFENNLNLRDNQNIRNLKKLQHYIDMYFLETEKEIVINRVKRLVNESLFTDTFKEQFCNLINNITL